MRALLALTILRCKRPRFPAAAAGEVAVRLFAVPVRAVWVMRGHKLVANAALSPVGSTSRVAVLGSWGVAEVAGEILRRISILAELPGPAILLLRL